MYPVLQNVFMILLHCTTLLRNINYRIEVAFHPEGGEKKKIIGQTTATAFMEKKKGSLQKEKQVTRILHNCYVIYKSDVHLSCKY